MISARAPFAKIGGTISTSLTPSNPTLRGHWLAEFSTHHGRQQPFVQRFPTFVVEIGRPEFVAHNGVPGFKDGPEVAPSKEGRVVPTKINCPGHLHVGEHELAAGGADGLHIHDIELSH
ncbi:MAG: hypothetical protein BJ554DRAFT_3743 [Olpidium bornovanus]|uniref:Uncharacterized protein n=1 Tax=Olpidium bornovanus TaxID=278681 RepID=A0A8H8DFF8_9FUNG|nr:MAG: hypothetical protein BJ554DRAFT_3743 [Olpidium bornovanus]